MSESRTGPSHSIRPALVCIDKASPLERARSVWSGQISDNVLCIAHRLHIAYGYYKDHKRQALVLADITTIGTAESSLKVTHVGHPRSAYQITAAAALYFLTSFSA